MKDEYKAGYLYVLVHPSDPNLYKIGVTVLPPEERLAQHNTQFDTAAGRIVQGTGQPWAIKTVIEVPDVYWAERAFWGSTGLTDIPGGVSVEVHRLDWDRYVQPGLNAAMKAGVRPPPTRTWPVKNKEWMLSQLEGTGITIRFNYRGPKWPIQFQCAQGHVFKAFPSDVAKHKSCPHCAGDWGRTFFR